MGQTVPLSHPMSAGLAEHAAAKTTPIPWYIWANLIAVMSGVFGAVWDISWHESIGRDTFWTTAHMFIYACGVLAGLSCAYLILTITFQKNNPMRESSVTM